MKIIKNIFLLSTLFFAVLVFIPINSSAENCYVRYRYGYYGNGCIKNFNDPSTYCVDIFNAYTPCQYPFTVAAITTSNGYTFSRWNDGSIQNPRTDIPDGIVIPIRTAYFSASSSFKLTYEVSLNGIITGNAIQTNVASGASGSTVTAVPNPGYMFTGWNDGSTQNPRTDINVQRDITVKGFFRYPILRYTAGANGSISGFATQDVPIGGNGTAVEAIPLNTYYSFVNWSDGSIQNPRTDINVNGDINVTANFTLNMASPMVMFNSPIVPGVHSYNPGEEFYLTGTVFDLSSAYDNYIYTEFYYGGITNSTTGYVPTWTFLGSPRYTCQTGVCPVTLDFSFGPFDVPTSGSTGTYYVYFKYANTRSALPNQETIVYQPFFVLPLKAVCGSAARTYAAEENFPGAYSLCALGNSYPVSPTDPQEGWATNWQCIGEHPGGADSGTCTASRQEVPLLNGVCGTAANTATAVAPSSGLCSAGTQSYVWGNGPWNWYCYGTGVNHVDAKCSAPTTLSGVCQ